MVTDTLDLHAFAPRDVKVVVEEYLFMWHEQKIRYARIIHGKGIGVQREIVRSILSKSPFVEAFEEGPNWGSTAIVVRTESN